MPVFAPQEVDEDRDAVNTAQAAPKDERLCRRAGAGSAYVCLYIGRGAEADLSAPW